MRMHRDATACMRTACGRTHHNARAWVQPADLKDMAKCCKDLSHFGAESSAVKGYIAMMPLFRNAPDRKVHPPWLPGAPQKEARTYALNQQLSDLVHTIIHEKAVLSLVFSTWKVRCETAILRLQDTVLALHLPLASCVALLVGRRVDRGGMWSSRCYPGSSQG